MTSKTLTRLNIFLFMIWIEIIIFSIALVISTYTIKPFSSIIITKYSYFTYDCLRISTVFFYTALIQHLYRQIIEKTVKINLNIILGVINSSAVSLFFINTIIKKTIISKYNLSYTGIFICFILPFLVDILKLIKDPKNIHS